MTPKKAVLAPRPVPKRIKVKEKDLSTPEHLLEAWEKRKAASASFTFCIEKPLKGSYNKNYRVEESLQDNHLLHQLDKRKTYYVSVKE